MSQIKNIIFDYGGVFLLLDEEKTYEAFRKLGLLFISQQLVASNNDFQRGRITRELFIENLKKELPYPTSSEKIIDAWCAMLGGLPQQRIDFLKKLKTKYRLFLLSNTDDIHIERVTKTVPNATEFLSNFEKVYYSQNTGYRKPEREIFELVIRENAINPSETLFVDDVKENAEAASVVGIHYHWLDLSKETVLDMEDILEKENYK
ncbi:MAG: HAD family phosphatase [Flavobacteriales bacterium]|nr:HAD family phosphatase [Flavobacteriales bacterium]